MNDKLRLLILEDSPDDADLLTLRLEEAGFKPDWKRVQTERDFLAALADSPELILADYSLPGFTGIEALRLRNERGLDIPFILISGTMGEDVAVNAMRNGADDYLLKDRPARLGEAVRHALRQKELRDQEGRAQELLRASEERYRTLTEAAQDMITVVNREGRVEYTNTYAARQFGVAQQDLVGKRLSEIFPVEVANRQQANLQKVFDGGQSAYVEAPSVFRGQTLWLGTRLAPIRDETGRVSAVLVVSRDITERKQAEESLRKSMEQTARAHRTLQAINLAAQAAQRAHSPQAIYQAAGAEIKKLGFDLAVLEFDADKRELSAAYNSYAESVVRAAEKLAGATAGTYRFRVADDGYYQRALTADKPVLYTDVINIIAEALPSLLKPLTRSLGKLLGAKQGIYSALKVGGQPWGVMAVMGNELGEEDIPAVEALSSQVSIALENARLYQDALDAAERRAALYRNSQAMVRVGQDVEQIYAAAHQATTHLMPAEVFTIVLFDEGRQELDGVYLFDRGGRSPSQRIPMGKGFSSKVIASGEALLFQDLEKTPVEAVHFGTKELVRSLAAVPMRVGDKVFGVMSAQSYQANTYHEEDRVLLEMLAAQVAVSIQNVRLYEQAQREIAERRQAEEALRHSEEYFRALIENGSDIITVLDAAGTIRYESPSVERSLGYRPEDLVGRNVFDLIHPDDLPRAMEVFARTFPTPGVVSEAVEMRFLRKDGSWNVLEVIGQSMADKSGALIGIINSRDISERKLAEQTLAENEERYRDLVENIHELICTHDLDGTVLSANRAAAKMLGYAHEEMIGKNLRDFLAPEVRHHFDIYLSLIQKRGSASGLMNVQTKSGEVRVWEYHNTLRTEGVDKPIVRGYAHDVTEKRRAEQALRESETRYRGIFGGVQEAIFVESPAGDILDVNESACAMFGYSRDELLTKKVSDLVPPERAALALGENGLGGLTEHFIETVNLRANGEEFPVEVSGRKHLLNGQPCLLVVVRDITERKQAEMEIQRRNADLSLLNAINQAVNRGESLAEVVHIVSEGIKRIFDTHGATVYLLEKNGHERLVNQNMALPPDLLAKIEKLVGISIPRVELDLREDHPFRRVFETKKIEVLKDPRQMVQHYVAFADSANLPAAVRAVARKAMPAVQQLVGAQAEMLIPLVSNGKAIGVMDLASRDPFTEEDVQRMEAIAAQLTAAIQRKQSEEALRESEEKYRSLFEHIPDGIFRTAPDGRILAANPALAAALGYESPQEMMRSVRAQDLYADSALREGFVATLNKRGETANLEVILRRQDGSPRVFLENARAVQDAAGEVLYYEGVLTDITARKQADEKERKQAAALEAAANGIAITDRNGKIEWVNLAWSALTGYAREEAIGKNPRILKSGRQPFEFYKDMWNTILAGKVWRGELVNKRKDGSLYDEEETITPVLDERGEIVNFVAVKQDISERKQAEEKIRRQVDYLTALREIDRAITSTFDMRLSLDSLIAKAVSLLDVDAASILLVNSALNTLHYAAGQGFRTRLAETAEVKLGESYAGRAALQRRMVQIPNIAEDPQNPLLGRLLKGENFVGYHGVPLIVKGKAIGVLEIFHRKFVERDQEWLDFLNTLAGQAAIAIDNAQLFERIQSTNLELSYAYEATIEGWSRAMDLRDKETEGHTQRVTNLTLKLARAMGISQSELIHIRRGSLLHDIGKMGVPDRILLKSDKLTDEEWEVMRQHPIYAYRMLEPIGYLQPALNIPYCHHEKWDGTGYPRGLAGEEIPLEARIFALVDVWDAVTSDRPYRPAWTKEAALEYIREQSGRHFAPNVVEAFLRLTAEDQEIGLQSGA